MKDTINFKEYFKNFFLLVKKGEVEIYNEFSLQHELGVYLRPEIPDLKVQFERPVSFFGLNKEDLEKKETDISVYSEDHSTKYVIELKYPRNGQHPEQMFSVCKDICFCEQLHQKGFVNCFSIIVVDDPLFYEGEKKTGIYQHFRSDVPVHGEIRKPTGKKDCSFKIKGSYPVIWESLKNNIKYAVVEIANKK